MRGCGDGFVDTDAGEQCDDGDEEPYDGCEPGMCTFTCTRNDQCDDGNDCNGTETCTDHYCPAVEAPGDGAPCDTDEIAVGVCVGTMCVRPGCDNGLLEEGEQCDDGNMMDHDGCDADCTFSCEVDSDCLNDSVCDGEETCSAAHVCVPGTPRDCTPDACHVEMCDPTAGCVNPLIDADMDGYASETLGACGNDCNDGDPNIHPGADEDCDGVDQNCDHVADDDIMPTWYLDCDGDGYAMNTDGARTVCVEPDPSAPGCASGGGWTLRRPMSPETTDCNDNEARRSPGNSEAVGDADNLDEDCDGAIACYVDNDDDNHRGAGGAVVTIVTGTCAGDGLASASAPANDCCDNDARVYGGQGACFAGPTNCGGYDFNCSGGGTPCEDDAAGGICRPTATSCTGLTPGWEGTTPGCGGSGSYATGCLRVRVCDSGPCFWDCQIDEETRQQTCR